MNEYLSKIRNRLDLDGREKDQIIDELNDHFIEIQEELREDGIDESQIADETAKRMGDPEIVAGRISAAHNICSWKTSILAALPFVFMLVSGLFKKHTAFQITGILAVISLIICIYQLIRNHRPYWMSTWIVYAFVSTTGFVIYIAVGKNNLLITPFDIIMANRNIIYLAFSIPLFLALFIYRKSKIFLFIIGFICLFLIFIHIIQNMYLFVSCFFLLYLLVIFSFPGLMMSYPEGNRMKGMLTLFIITNTIKLNIIEFTAFGFLHGHLSYLMPYAEALILAMSMILFCRASSKDKKILILLYCALILTLLNMILKNSFVITYMLAYAISRLALVGSKPVQSDKQNFVAG